MDIQLIGIEELDIALTINHDLDKVKEVVRYHYTQLNKKAQRNAQRGASFKKGYSKGDTKRSIATNSSISADGLTATVQATTNYAMYVELGTRKMTAQPFIKPAFDEVVEQFKEDIAKAVQND